MAWSTRQLAEVAGTTTKTVRHYHAIGLLELPERATNGYKQYGVGHLIRLLRITRLTDLGVPLSKVEAVGHSDAGSERALHVLDAELASDVERLRRARAEVGSILRHQSSTDLPPGFRPIDGTISATDRALILVYSRVLGPAEMDDIREIVVELSRDPAHGEFDSLRADAGEDQRSTLASHYAPVLRAIRSRFPWIENPGSRAPRGAAFADSTLRQAMQDLYNAAQLDVLRRVNQVVSA